jgi:hypothetical protein
MQAHEIPNAFLIRALARRESEQCDGCSSRMYVKGPSGLCPFCRAGRPALNAVSRLPRVEPSAPFAPRLGDRALGAEGGLARIAARARRARRATGRLALPGAGAPQTFPG